MRSAPTTLACLCAALIATIASPARAQSTPSSADALGLGAESAALAALRGADCDNAPLPRTVAEAIARDGTPLPEGLDASTAARLQMPNIPLRITPRIAAYLARYRTDRISHRALASWLRRAGRYRVRIEAILASESMPTELVWIAAAESGFDPNSVSWVGAAGLWQLMPDTARSYGLRVDAWVDERRDPERATRAAAHMLRDLHTRFGSWDLALAAYNMGYAALLRAMRKYNTNDFERIASLEAGLPFETTSYVPRILAATIGARNVTALGFDDAPPDAALTWEDVPVMRSVPIDQLAHAIGISTEAFRALNPSLLASRTPPPDDARSFVVHLPLGTRDRAVAWIDRAVLPATRAYTVRHGETADEIAHRSGLANGGALLALGGLAASTHLAPGDLVLVPSEAQPNNTGAAPEAPPLVAVDPIAQPPAGRRRVFYHVVQGESLRDVTSALGVNGADLATWNALDTTASLQGGLWLQAFVAGETPGARVWEEREVSLVERGSEAFYDRAAANGGRVRRRVIVRDGDTMRSLADRYGLTVGSLARINHRSRHAALAAGEEVIVYAAQDSPSSTESPDPPPGEPSSSSAPASEASSSAPASDAPSASDEQ